MTTDAALARRIANGRRTRRRTKAGQSNPIFSTPTVVQRLRELQADSPLEPLSYSASAVAVLLNIEERRVRGLVASGALPSPDRIVAGSPRWLASAIDPILVRLGKPTLDERVRADVLQSMREGAVMNLRGRSAPRR